MAIYLTEKENMRGNAWGNSYGLKFQTGNIKYARLEVKVSWINQPELFMASNIIHSFTIYIKTFWTISQEPKIKKNT